ncbi:MAG: Txe/YoeB family addiction module toxin [Spirochaetaceae bacterium]|jgi:toxin YoeB|nr:Txe/YoeB family addiction module toxin [Spirochaetaceae bacterium]
MKRTFTDEGWDDYQHWQETNRKQVKRINQLIEDIDRHPFTGIGKPEPLKGNLSGYWSRRIDSEHRLIYAVDEIAVTYISFRYHYTK